MLDIVTLLIFLLTLTIAFLRGCIKEVFGLFGMLLSFVLTYYNYDFFSDVIGIKSKLVANFISSFMMYMVVIIAITIINSGIMYILRPLRLGVTDRILGLMVGALKGFVFSFLFFLTVKVVYYTISTADKKTEENVLPKWILQSKVYVPFHYVEENLDQVLPEYFYDNLKEFGNKFSAEIRPSLEELEDKETKQQDKDKAAKEEKHQDKAEKVGKVVSKVDKKKK